VLSFIHRDRVPDDRWPWLLNVEGIALAGLRRNREAIGAHQQMRKLAEALPAGRVRDDLVSTALQNLGIVTLEEGRAEEAIELLRESLRMKVALSSEQAVEAVQHPAQRLRPPTASQPFGRFEPRRDEVAHLALLLAGHAVAVTVKVVVVVARGPRRPGGPSPDCLSRRRTPGQLRVGTFARRPQARQATPSPRSSSRAHRGPPPFESSVTH
jgi:hypothetical protein